MSIIFGFSFLFTKNALNSFQPMALIAYRFDVAAIVLVLLLKFKIINISFKSKPLKEVVLLSIFYPVLAFILEINGLKFAPSSQAGIIMSLMPIFVMLLGIIFLGEKPKKTQKIFIAISVIGVLTTILFVDNKANSNVLGIVFFLFSVLFGSIHSILSRQSSLKFTSIEITYSMIVIGSIIFSLIAITQGILTNTLYEMFISPLSSIDGIVSILYLGILSSVIAFFCLNYMLSKLMAVTVSVFTNLATLISIFAGVAFGNEKLYWYQIIGGIFILTGVIGTSYYSSKNISSLKEV